MPVSCNTIGHCSKNHTHLKELYNYIELIHGKYNRLSIKLFFPNMLLLQLKIVTIKKNSYTRNESSFEGVVKKLKKSIHLIHKQ